METPSTFKILLIGDNEVGRKTLLKDSSIFNEDNMTGIGLDFYRKEINIEGRRIILQFWNVSNDDRFRLPLGSYIRGSNGVFFMFDLTNASILGFLSKFSHLIREGVGGIPILLIGNKNDLYEDREVSEEQARAFLKEKNLIGYREISAKTGQGCEELFELLGEKIILQLHSN